MSEKPIVILPDPRLYQASQPVKTIDQTIHALVDDMFASMYAARGIGLAAVQIGALQRVIVVDLGKEPERDEESEDGKPRDPDPHVFINPEIVWASEETRIFEEACLSIPDYREEVERPERIKVRYQTLTGDILEMETGGLMATCLQHEVDHLNGVLFIDHLSRLKRERVIKKFTKAARRDGTS